METKPHRANAGSLAAMSCLSSARSWSATCLVLLLLGACGGRVPPPSEGPPDPSNSSQKPSKAPKWKRASESAIHISEEGYLLPPAEVVQLLETESPPEPFLHKTSQRLVQLYGQQLRGMDQTSRPSLGLAGLRIDGENLILREEELYTRFDIRTISKPTVKAPQGSKAQERRRVIHPPEGALFGRIRFSPSGALLAVTLIYADHVGVGIYDWAEDELRVLEVGRLSRIWDEPCSFLDEERLLCSRALHSGEPPGFESGPKTRELKTGAVPSLAYSNLLRDANDDALFEHYASVQPIIVHLDGRQEEILPIQGIIPQYSISEDEKYLLSTTLEPPFSRLLPADKMPRRVLVHDLATGQQVLSLDPNPEDSIPGSSGLGVRGAVWAHDKASTLSYLRRRLDAHGRAEDVLVFHDAPFTSSPNAIAAGLKRVQNFGWTSAGTLYITDADLGPRSWVSYLVRDGQRQVLKSGGDNHAGDPARALRVNGNQGPVLEDKGMIFFAGDELPPGSIRPSLVSFKLIDSSTHILWRSGQGEHAQVFAVLDARHPQYLLRSETPSRPSSFSVTGSGSRRRVTELSQTYEALEGVRRHLLRYRRADGAMLSAMLYLPPNFEPRQKIPTVFWIYPREVDGFSEASLPTEEPFRYFLVKGPSRFALLTQGYALVDSPSMPIVGRVKSGSNDFLPQLEQSAKAAIDHLVQLGVSDAGRIAVVGRSYGAFGTANLMVHTELFRTGVAISGAYNRTLTPFGFQTETRSFWQNTDAYVNMSPFFFADKMKGSLLLLHGELDDNPGTPVLQSERFYAALAGNGVRSRYVSFPFEGHQFRGREAVLHSSAEMIRWLDTHLKN